MSAEITALLKLVDDPDQEVFKMVSKKIVTYGDEILPYLEELEWTTESDLIHARVETLYHLIQMEHVKKGLADWAASTQPDLLVGACLFNQFTIHNTDFGKTFKAIEKLQRDIWIELNQYLTPLEKTKVITEMIYRYHGFSSVEINYKKSEHFLLDTLLKTKQSNSFALAVLYALVAQQLDLPITILKFPKQFLLAFLNPHYDYQANPEANFQHILFFIDPSFGGVITHQEVEIFFKRIGMVPEVSHFMPLSNKEVIRHWFIEYSNCFPQNIAGELLEDIKAIIKILA